ncbi:hypothetical protein [Aeromicrobium sp. Root495]|uniref:hypothetical protein n=1 Tax=Aeromicrobium sp. Root495 TaxID=1736550 RepID=UPI0012E70881|nr:hypothetical protein [Aeromicrobium sp. Root495]
MTVRHNRCAFCFADSEEFPLLTAEHLLSRPVASSFGIDRTATFARFDEDDSQIRWTTVNGVKRKCVCAACNNGWMNALEHDMGRVANWVDAGSAELRTGELDVLAAWSVKTHLLLCHIEGRAGEFGDSDEAVVPPASAARAVYERRFSDLDGLVLGLAANSSDTDFAYEFGTPGRVSFGDQLRGGRTCPVSIVSVGRLQIWILTPLPLDPEVRVADGVRAAAAGLRFEDLTAMPAIGNRASISINYRADWPLG